MWCWRVVSCAPLVVVFHRVHWVQVVRSCSHSLGVFLPFALPLSLSCFACGALHLNMALFRILRGFLARFWGADVYLYVLRSLRGLCGFCTRVELGGLKACGVFCLSFSSFLLLSSLFLLSSCSCPASLLGFFSWSCPLSLCGLLFLFPLRYMRKKKGRAVLVRPLFSLSEF